jgi:sugar-specific transcriptional regulator TrmB
LVERILAKPLKFRATSIKNAIEVLSGHQESKNSELRDKAMMLFDHSEQWEKTQESNLNEPSFELRNLYRNDPRVKAAIRDAKDRIRLLDKNMHWPVFYSFIDEWTYALKKRGVKIEVLIEFATNRQIKPNFLDDLKKIDIQIKYVKILPAGAILIFDDKEVVIWEGAKPRQVAKSAPVKALWSNHHGLIELASNYFESYWKTASSLEKLHK